MAAIGYARVSTSEQCLDLQRNALQAAGCSHIEKDEGVSGSATRRVGLDRALAALRPGDTLVTWRLDRLGRSLPHLIDTIAGLRGRGIAFRSVTENIDTSSASGELIFHIFASLAQFERALIRERTNAGLAAARARGTKLGPRFSLNEEQTRHAAKLAAEGKSHREIAKLLSKSRSSVQRALSRVAVNA